MLQNPKYFIYFCSMKHVFFIISLLLCLPLAAQQIYRARVVDADTGEALPYASVTSSSGRKVLTNDHGTFSIPVYEKDVVSISYVGYELQSISVSKSPKNIRLIPISSTLTEVEVVPVEKLMLKLIKKLNRENKRNSDLMATYFFRLTSINDNEEEDIMVEYFCNACSSINVNNPIICTGRIWTHTGDGAYIPKSFQHSNLHRLMELGPEIPLGCRNPVSKKTLLPLPEKAIKMDDLQGRNFTCEILRSKHGEEIYKIGVDINTDEVIKECEDISNTHIPLILSGTIYVTKKLRLLRFDGQLKGVSLREYLGTEKTETTKPADIGFHMYFTHENFCTVPAVIHCNIKTSHREIRMVQLKVKRINDLMKFRKGDIPYRGDEDMIKAIMQTEYAPELWKDGLVEHTEEENRFIQEVMKKMD